MKELDRILAKHLQDEGLCKRGKQLNKQRKERLKLDLIAYFKSGVFDDMIIVTTPGMIVIDEQQLGMINMPPVPPGDRHLSLTDTQSKRSQKPVPPVRKPDVFI